MSTAKSIEPRAGDAAAFIRARLGMLLFLAAEAMVFAGLIAAFTVIRDSMPAWPPSDQPRLPLTVTALNMVVLFLSGAAVWTGGALAGQRRTSVLRRHFAAAGFGLLFVLVQGIEWLRLISHGLKVSGGPYAGSFYAVVGMHATHAVAGVLALVYVASRVSSAATGDTPALAAVRLYWYFVVIVWPILYATVYL